MYNVQAFFPDENGVMMPYNWGDYFHFLDAITVAKISDAKLARITLDGVSVWGNEGGVETEYLVEVFSNPASDDVTSSFYCSSEAFAIYLANEVLQVSEDSSVKVKWFPEEDAEVLLFARFRSANHY